MPHRAEHENAAHATPSGSEDCRACRGPRQTKRKTAVHIEGCAGQEWDITMPRRAEGIGTYRMSAPHSTAATIDTAESWTFANNDQKRRKHQKHRERRKDRKRPKRRIYRNSRNTESTRNAVDAGNAGKSLNQRNTRSTENARNNENSKRPETPKTPETPRTPETPETLETLETTETLETLDAFQDNCRQRHQQPVVDRRDAEEELVENHHLRCSAAPLADTTPQQDQEAAPAEQATEPTAEPAAAATMTTTLQDEQLQAQQQASRAVRIHRTTSAAAPRVPDMTSPELRSGQGTYCHESGATGYKRRRSRRHSRHLVAYPCLRRRGHDHPTRLGASPRSPRYRSGSDIPRSLNLTAGRSRSVLLRLLSPVDCACASFPLSPTFAVSR